MQSEHQTNFISSITTIESADKINETVNSKLIQFKSDLTLKNLNEILPRNFPSARTEGIHRSLSLG